MNVGELLGPGFAGLSDEKRLERTAKELESVLVTQLLSAMRNTVPESGLFGESLADDVFRSMLDEQLARATSEKSPFGLSDAIVKSLQKRIKAAEDPTETRGVSDVGRGADAARTGTARFRRIG